MTARVLSLGTILSANALALSFVATQLNAASIAAPLATIGIVALLATPAAGLMATWWELRTVRSAYAWMAVAVLFVLALATIIALIARA